MSDSQSTKWPPWRITMLAGALVLLGNAILNVIMATKPPGWLTTILVGSGYALLIIGFGLAMRARDKTRSVDKSPKQ